MKKIKKNIAASWCCEASTVVDIQKLVKKVRNTELKVEKRQYRIVAMKLIIDTALRKIYFESLYIVKNEQPELWEFFCKNVPTLSVAFYNHFSTLGGLLTYIRYYKNIRENAVFYRKVWNVHKDDVIARLDKLFGYTVEDTIVAVICVSPLYLRNIHKKIFIVPTNADEERILEIIVHELSHFYFYKSEIGNQMPECKRWKLSEQIVPFIIKELFYDICSNSGSYVDAPNDNLKRKIYCWMDGEISFEELLNSEWGENKYDGYEI